MTYGASAENQTMVTKWLHVNIRCVQSDGFILIALGLRLRQMVIGFAQIANYSDSDNDHQMQFTNFTINFLLSFDFHE